MPSIIVPRRQLVQPQGYAQPAGQSWLTYLPSVGINSPINGKTLSNVGVTSAAGYSGIAANIEGAGDYLQFTPSENIPSAFHLVSVFDLDATSIYGRLFEFETESTGDMRFGIWFSPSAASGTNGNANSIVILRNVTGSSGGGAERWTTPTNSLVRPLSGVVLEVIWEAKTSDSTTPSVWINGVPQTMTKCQSAIISSAAFAPLNGVACRIGNRFGTADRGMLGKLYLLHIERGQRTQPYGNPWQLFRESPRRLYFDVPNGAATVSSDGVIRWSLISSVQADQALRWSLQAAVHRDASLLWSLLQSVQSDATARWSLIAAINADATLRYSLVQAVQQDAALRWSMLAAVSADVALLWDMAGATGVVSRDFAARWSMLAPVNADAALHWSLLNAVARDVALPWSMVQAIASDRALRWSLIQAVQADADIAWRLVQAVSRDAVLAWDLAASLGTVGASLSLRWSLIAAVQRSIDARWSLLQSVGADAEMRWDLLTSLTAELTARWSMIGRAMADTPIRWDLMAASATDLVIRWQVGEVFDLVVRKRFVAGAGMRRSFVV